MSEGSESFESEFGVFRNKEIYSSETGMLRSLEQFVGKGLQREDAGRPVTYAEEFVLESKCERELLQVLEFPRNLISTLQKRWPLNLLFIYAKKILFFF